MLGLATSRWSLERSGVQPISQGTAKLIIAKATRSLGYILRVRFEDLVFIPIIVRGRRKGFIPYRKNLARPRPS
jgi:hypothetical protein